MNIRDMIEIINILTALIAIPPALILLFTVRRESKATSPEQKDTNKALLLLFVGVNLVTFINAGMAIASALGGGIYSHTISPYRSLLINVFFSVFSWFLYFSHIRIRKQTKK